MFFESEKLPNLVGTVAYVSGPRLPEKVVVAISPPDAHRHAPGVPGGRYIDLRVAHEEALPRHDGQRPHDLPGGSRVRLEGTFRPSTQDIIEAMVPEDLSDDNLHQIVGLVGQDRCFYCSVPQECEQRLHPRILPGVHRGTTAIGRAELFHEAVVEPTVGGIFRNGSPHQFAQPPPDTAATVIDGHRRQPFAAQGGIERDRDILQRVQECSVKIEDYGVYRHAATVSPDWRKVNPKRYENRRHMKRRTARRERHRGDTAATTPDNRRGETGFHHYYRSVYGERWDALLVALQADGPRLAWTFDDELRAPAYYLDPASVVVAHLLPLGERNLDMCAAPGGKALVLARRLVQLETESRTGESEPGDDNTRIRPGPFSLVVNERSRDRRARLRRVLEDHLPEAARRFVRITGHDAARWGLHEPEHYDAILADVPCSSERHVLAAPRELERWSDTRVRRLAVQQFAILAAAVDSLRPGGHVLYATCALTPEENDAVVSRALARRSDRIELVSPGSLQSVSGSERSSEEAAPHSAAMPASAAAALAGAEATEFGLHIMPDRCGGAGPLYCALLRRTRER